MHLAFVDFVYHYDAARPDINEALGGTTSAICFLAREMVKNGVECTFYNRASEKRRAYGVTTLPIQLLADDLPRGLYDAYIFCGRWTEEIVGLVRAQTSAPLIAWMHESRFVAPMTPPCDAFDGVVFVSEWQRRVNQSLVKTQWRQAVIRNAMNPAVASLFAPDDEILAAKTTPPVLLFAGSFARGAFHLPAILERVHAERRDFAVEIFCDLNSTHNLEQGAAYQAWLRNAPNIAHIGAVGQNELARCMKRASVLLAPNPWPETSCIALIEGLAAGMRAVITTRAALPETAAGFARQIAVDNADDPARFDMTVDYDFFAASVLAVLQETEQNRSETETTLRRQIDYFRAHYQWSQRVAPWMAFIGEISGRS